MNRELRVEKDILGSLVCSRPLGPMYRGLEGSWMTPKVKSLSADSFIPLWNAEMGVRLRTARQVLDLDQVEMAKDLGVSQSTLAKLEAGRSRGSRAAITLEHWTRVLGEHTRYVLLGQRAYAYNSERIRVLYMLKRFNGRQTEPDNKSYVYQRKKRLGIK